MIPEIKADDLLADVKDSGVVVLKVSAPWCGACKAIAPAVKKVADENENVKFYELNADENMDFVMGLGIRSLPTYVFYKNGEQVHIEKAMTEAGLRKKVAELQN